MPAATAEESEKVLRWLESPGVRLVDVEGEWSLPGRRRRPGTSPSTTRSSSPGASLVPFAERRDLTPVAPARSLNVSP